MATREASLGIVVGRKRIGKTFLTIQLLKQYVAGNPAKGIKPRRVIIFDVNNEYNDVKAMRLSDVDLFSRHPIIEMRRIQPFKTDGSAMTIDDIANALAYIVKVFKGGLLLLEDINQYVTDSMPQVIVGAICTNAHKACDIIIHLQSLGRILPKLWQNTAWVRYHKQYDTVEDNKGKLKERYQIFKLTELMVDKKYDAGDKRYYLHVDLSDNKIIGNYTKQDMLEAIQRYMSENFQKVVGTFVDQRDMKGNKIYTIEQAMPIIRRKLYLDYYGN